MKIAFVSQPFDGSTPPIEAGSIPIWTYQVALRIAHEHAVTICGLRTPGASPTQTEEGIRYVRFTSRGERWIQRVRRMFGRFSHDPTRPFHASVLHYLVYALRVALHVRRERYDIVHVHNFLQFVSVIRWMNRSVPIVAHTHGEWFTQQDRKLVTDRLRKADLVIGCSAYLVTRLRTAVPDISDRTRIIFNGVDTDRFKKLPEKLLRLDVDPAVPAPALAAERPGCVEILFVGRHSPEKGVHDLLDAAKLLAHRGRNFRLTIVGPMYVVPSDVIVDMSDDPDVLALKRFYRTSQDDQETYLSHLRDQRADGLDALVEFVGAVPHSRLPALYRRSSILASASLSETFGIPLVEAMACELPVVATRVGGMVEVVVDEETGLLTDPAAPRQLADALDRLILDEDLRRRLGSAGRQRVLEKFAWEQVARDLLRAYEDVISR